MLPPSTFLFDSGLLRRYYPCNPGSTWKEANSRALQGQALRPPASEVTPSSGLSLLTVYLTIAPGVKALGAAPPHTAVCCFIKSWKGKKRRYKDKDLKALPSTLHHARDADSHHGLDHYCPVQTFSRVLKPRRAAGLLGAIANDHRLLDLFPENDQLYNMPCFASGHLSYTYHRYVGLIRG
ncbi:MAG: hypothetical protein J3Q66DRAFT_366600 [Benniella sp.]|nr:MAG: hypothetical protein J3Q66DRAFT_366600 [Benniella sp.]